MNILKSWSLKLAENIIEEHFSECYNMFNDEKVSPLATQLTWSHYTELLSIKDSNKLTYYINVTKDNNLSKRKLREKN